jgi:phosphoglycerol transferase MdoB-like AlkP superfamily enzyme
VSLVVYLVESLMDPNDLGLRFTLEPMPHLRRLAAEQVHGRAIVPREYGGSGNTEFALLTGMSHAFLPSGSIPYRQYVRRPLPALPRVLRDLGYATTSIQADPRHYYDRERVYPLLGFERSLWLHDEPVRQRAPRGYWPSDASIVDAVIEASERSRPFFVFAFPSSTHSPYDTGIYARSDLRAVDAPGAADAEVQEYVNAVRGADSAIGRMIEYFRQRPDSVIVAIMGDHLPPLSSAALSHFSRRIARLPRLEQARAARAVPLVVWANFTLPPGELTVSANMLPGYLLERMGVPAGVLLTATDSVRRTLPVVSEIVQDTSGHLWAPDSVPRSVGPAFEDYRLLQYDLLLGKGYAASPTATAGSR